MVTIRDAVAQLQHGVTELETPNLLCVFMHVIMRLLNMSTARCFLRISRRIQTYRFILQSKFRVVCNPYRMDVEVLLPNLIAGVSHASYITHYNQ